MKAPYQRGFQDGNQLPHDSKSLHANIDPAWNESETEESLCGLVAGLAERKRRHEENKLLSN